MIDPYAFGSYGELCEAEFDLHVQSGLSLPGDGGDMPTVDLKLVSSETRRLMGAGAKILEIRDAAEANAVADGGGYYLDRLSESRNAYILIRRERK